MSEFMIITIAIAIMVFITGFVVNMSIYFYYISFTNTEEKRIPFYILLSWFVTKKIIGENKKYSYCPKKAKESFFILLFVCMIILLCFLNEKGIIDLAFVVEPLDRFNRWMDGIFNFLLEPFFKLLKMLW